MLENGLESGEFINIFVLILGEILGTEKCDLCKSRFLGVFLAGKRGERKSTMSCHLTNPYSPLDAD